MKGKVLILFSLILSGITLLAPLELLSREASQEGSPAGFAEGTIHHLEEANKSFQSNNVVEATLHLIQARENLNKLQKQIQDAQTRINDAVQYLNQAKPQQADASVLLALDALNPTKQVMESKPAPTQRDRRENLRTVKNELIQARNLFKEGDVAGAIQSIRSAQDALGALQQQYPQYQSQIQEAQSQLDEAVYLLNQNKPREAAKSVRGAIDLLEPLREGQ